MNKNMNFINIGRWADILPNIEKDNVSKLARKSNITYPYLISMIVEFEKRGWVTSEKIKREKIIRLTPLGKEVVNTCCNINKHIKERK